MTKYLEGVTSTWREKLSWQKCVRQMNSQMYQDNTVYPFFQSGVWLQQFSYLNSSMAIICLWSNRASFILMAVLFLALARICCSSAFCWVSIAFCLASSLSLSFFFNNWNKQLVNVTTYWIIHTSVCLGHSKINFSCQANFFY